MKGSRAGLGSAARRVVLLGAMAAGLLFLPSALVSPQSAEAYKVCSDGNCNHETMVAEALNVYSTEFFNYIQEGVTHEDQKDHVFAYAWIADGLVTNTHLWDSDRGEHDPVELPPPAWVSGVTSTENAWEKAQALWSLALGAYAKGNMQFAYHYFGHVVHLLGDQTLPTHAHDDAHGPTDILGIPIEDDSFEEWMRNHAAISAAERAELVQAGPLPIPATYPDKLFWLMYTTNQIADFFASDDVDGDAVDARGLAQPDLNTMAATISSPRTTDQLDDNDGQPFDPDQLPKSDNNDDDGDLTVIRKHSYLRGIRAIAALYKLFEQTVKQQVTLGVVINRVEEDSKHDAICPAPGCDPDFYARVAIAGLESRNRGDARQEGEDIDPDWMFGNTVGTSGSVPVRIEIWDEDGLGVGAVPCCPDEQSDIDINGDYGDRALELNVDLGKCLRREPGAISGDVSGACGERLTDGGDAEDDPSSRVSFTIISSKAPPTADAGGPYTTNEGTDVTLDGTGSSDPDNDITTYAWDLDNDGNCDDATGAKPSFTDVGQDRTRMVKLCVTDAVGLTDEDTTTVKIDNVSPSLSVSSNAPTGENTTVTVSGTISDPGWLDPLSGTISWGDGSAVQTLAGSLENVRPNATLTFSATHVYGDNGMFTAQICAADDDVKPCTSFPLQITNTPPTAAIDLSGAIDVNGTPTVIAHAGSSVGFNGRATDPGSDDLTLAWKWGDGTPDASKTDLVNPPNADPAVSPSIQPRDLVFGSSHTFTGACAYETTFAVGDDDGGTASQTAAVIIVGNGHPNQPHGYWKQQFRFYNSGKANADFDAGTLGCYLKIVNYMSSVFDQRTDASTFLRAEDVLETNLTSEILELFDQQLLAAWLNFANGAVEWNRLVDTNGDKRPDTRFLDAITAAERLRLDPSSTRTQLERQKVIVESWTKLP
jgi:PKD domain